MASLKKSSGGLGGAKKKSKVHPEMNVTPLVDVVLVLLIIFMVLAPVVAANFLANLPPKPEETEVTPPPPADADKPIVVKVFEDAHIEVNSNTLPPETFVEDLDKLITGMSNARVAKGRSASRTVYLDAEGKAPYGLVLETIDKARLAKASRVVLLTEEIADKDSKKK